MDVAIDVLSVVGICVLLYFVVYKVYPCLCWFYAYFIRRPKDLLQYGTWGIVTGATAGIGKGYAFALARAGLNVLIISRNPEKCQAVQEELQAEFPNLQFSHLVIDYGHFDAEKREMLRKKIENLDIGVLVNNVFKGQGNLSDGGFHFLHEANDENIRLQTDLNLHGMNWMIRIVVGDETKGMISRKRGAIINIGSLTGYRTMGGSSLYACSKSWVIAMSKSLHAELSHHGIFVAVHSPCRVVTNMIKPIYDGPPTLLWPNGETYAESCRRMIGYETQCMGYWPHEFQRWLTGCVPQGAWDKALLEEQIQGRNWAIAVLNKQLDAVRPADSVVKGKSSKFSGNSVTANASFGNKSGNSVPQTGGAA